MIGIAFGSARIRALIIAIVFVLQSGCASLGLEDNATHLAFLLGGAAKELRNSTEHELVVKYEPLGNAHEDYAIEIRHSKREVRVDLFGNIDSPGGSSIVVGGKYMGGTNYHERFVFVPRDLKIRKAGAATEIVLRKSGDRIDLVELR